jgi:hypothetical protein
MTKTVKHTPGPWKMVSDTRFDSGLTYVSVQPVTPDAQTMRPLLMASGEHHICRMTHTAARHAIAMHEGNARLIAAAPEMYRELRGARCPRPCNHRPDDFEVGQCVDAAECGCSLGAAIAKAEGRS